MALISVKNFVTPFTNRVHLGTIGVLVAFFALYSAAGGRISLSASAPRPKSIERGLDLDAPSTAAQPQKRIIDELPSSMDDLDPARELSKLGIESDAMPPPSRSAKRPNSDLVDSMIKDNAGKRGAQGAADEADLDEVERRLGLR